MLNCESESEFQIIANRDGKWQIVLFTHTNREDDLLTKLVLRTGAKWCWNRREPNPNCCFLRQKHTLSKLLSNAGVALRCPLTRHSKKERDRTQWGSVLSIHTTIMSSAAVLSLLTLFTCNSLFTLKTFFLKTSLTPPGVHNVPLLQHHLRSSQFGLILKTRPRLQIYKNSEN